MKKTKKAFKKVLSVLMVLTMVLGIIPATTFIAEAATYTSDEALGVGETYTISLPQNIEALTSIKLLDGSGNIIRRIYSHDFVGCTDVFNELKVGTGSTTYNLLTTPFTASSANISEITINLNADYIYDNSIKSIEIAGQYTEVALYTGATVNTEIYKIPLTRRVVTETEPTAKKSYVEKAGYNKFKIQIDYTPPTGDYETTSIYRKIPHGHYTIVPGMKPQYITMVLDVSLSMRDTTDRYWLGSSSLDNVAALLSTYVESVQKFVAEIKSTGVPTYMSFVLYTGNAVISNPNNPWYNVNDLTNAKINTLMNDKTGLASTLTYSGSFGYYQIRAYSMTTNIQAGILKANYLADSIPANAERNLVIVSDGGANTYYNDATRNATADEIAEGFPLNAYLTDANRRSRMQSSDIGTYAGSSSGDVPNFYKADNYALAEAWYAVQNDYEVFAIDVTTWDSQTQLMQELVFAGDEDYFNDHYLRAEDLDSSLALAYEQITRTIYEEAFVIDYYETLYDHDEDVLVNKFDNIRITDPMSDYVNLLGLPDGVYNRSVPGVLSIPEGDSATITTQPDGRQMITWNIKRENLIERSIWYYVELKDPYINNTEYIANNPTTLTFVDSFGKVYDRDIPVPKVKEIKKEMKLGYDLYLVDENGNPIDLNGNRVSFNNRVVMSELKEVTKKLNSSAEIDYDELEEILPEGYYIYNPDAAFNLDYIYAGEGSGRIDSKITDTTSTTKVYAPTGTSVSSDGTVTGIPNDSNVKVTFAIAKIPDVKVSYDLYLVDENGNPVDENGNRVSFENRVVMSDLETITQSVGSDVEIGYDELEKLLPEGYYIYSPDASFTQTYTSTGTGGITDKISDTTSTTKVYDPSGATVLSNGTVTGITDYSDVKVTFAIAKIPDDIKVSYNLYLVDGNGNPIDTNGNTVSFDNRTVMSDLETITQSVGSDVEIGYDELLEILPEGYYIYSPDATFTQNYTSTGTGGVTDKISDTTSTTKVYDPSGATVLSNGTVTGITDYSDIKVTFAIAKVTILPDVIVADYGKPILCSPLDNDEGAKSIIGISAMDSAKPVSEVKTQNGIFKVEGSNVVFYPFSYMSSINRIKYYADVVDSANNSQQLSSTVSVIPATTVYYEDNFGGSAVNGGLYIKYSGDWFTVTDSGSKSGNLTAKVNSAEKQDRGEVGMGHIPYGFDSSYNGDTKFSDGTAAMVEGSINGTGTSKTYDATASFTFTGTGFDIISRTDLDCGLINVMIYDHDSGELIDSVPVINKGVENLYQIPVISYTGIPYDTYDVVINVSSPIAYLGITGSTFYLDAIRIYDPMGKKSSDNPEFDEANDAYNTDKEANAFVASIRDFIIQVDSLGVEESYGAVYVDTINNDYNAGGVIGNVKAPEFTDEQKRHRSMSEEDLNTFELVGPNEEVYLTPGYGIGFIVETNILPESVQLEIKMPTPAKTASQSVLSVQTYGKSGSQKNFSVKSATEMFYDITDAVQFTKTNGVYRATVILSNGLPSSANENEIVSVTNIKMTYPKNANASNNFGLDAAENGTVNLEQGTPEYAENAEMIALADCGAANVSLKASKELYKQVFDTVYVQRVASTPNYDVVNAEISDSVVSGEYADVTFNTAAFVDNVVLVDENGNEIALTDINCTTDESKRFTDDYLNTKTWTAKARLIADEGEHEYIVKSADETGETEVLTVDVKPAELKKLSVKTAPEKTVYAYGETIDTAGLKLEAEYTDDTEKTITDGMTFSNTTANRSGRMNITASVDGKTAEFTVDVVSLVSASDRTVVDLENKLVYGIEVNSPEIHDYVESIDEKATVSCKDAIVGTGSEINLLYGDEVIDTYSAVIFGDVNGDGWYDGTDSIIVNCLAMGLLSRAQVGEAVYMAADCNHDGEVDEIDVAILEEAGMLASSIDQTKSTEELVEVCSAFEDYVNLISQSVEPETVITEDETPTPEKTEETTTQAETTETQPEQQTEQSVFDTIVSLIKQLVSFITSMVAMFKSIF